MTDTGPSFDWRKYVSDNLGQNLRYAKPAKTNRPMMNVSYEVDGKMKKVGCCVSLSFFALVTYPLTGTLGSAARFRPIRRVGLQGKGGREGN